MQKYSMTQSQAQSAARFFIHMASLAGMELSDELSAAQVSKKDVPDKVEPSGRSSPIKRTLVPENVKPKIPALAVIDGPFGQIRVVDQSTLELARKLLDIVEKQLKP